MSAAPVVVVGGGHSVEGGDAEEAQASRTREIR